MLYVLYQMIAIFKYQKAKDRKEDHPMYNMVTIDSYFVHISSLPEDIKK